jgi:hypothetical protein
VNSLPGTGNENLERRLEVVWTDEAGNCKKSRKSAREEGKEVRVAHHPAP